MSLIYTILLSLFISVGASCTGDVTTLQRLINVNYDLNFFEPFSSLVLKILTMVSANQSAAILHFLAIFLIIFSFRRYFLSTDLISQRKFYLISFIFIFNPLTLLLVTTNTRQLFFTSLISFPFNYLVSNLISKNLNNEYSLKREKIFKNKFLPIVLMLCAFGAHSSFPLIFTFFGILFFVFNFLRYFYSNQIKFRIANSIRLRNIIYFTIFTPVLIYVFYLISDRLIYVIRLYGPFVKEIRALGGDMIYDTGSPSLLFSSLISLSLFFYLGYKIPQKYLLFKSFMFSAFLGVVLPFLVASIFPLLSKLLARSYMPIALLNMPFALVLIFEYINTKFRNLIIIIFAISSLSLQTQKYIDFDSKSTYFSLGNPDKYSCSLVPFRNN